MHYGERRSSPEWPTLISPGPWASGLLGRGPLSLKDGPQIRLRLRSPRPRPSPGTLVPARGNTGGNIIFLSHPV